MKNLKALLDLNKVSLFLIALPYLTFNFEKIIHSDFYSFSQLIFVITCIILIDLLIKWLLFNLNKKANTITSLFIIFISVLFLYGLYLTSFIQKGIQYYFLYLIRGRTMIQFSLAFFALLIFILRKKALNFQYLNVFLILLGVITFFNSITNSRSKGKQVFKSNFTHINLKNSPVKPILLIITDEYTSPDDLYQIYKYKSIYQFSNELNNNGWITKNRFYSYETSTIHSLSSLFNFNLSKKNQYHNEEIRNIGLTKLVHASIADSLEKKKVEIVNFGIFHLGKHPYLNRLYPYPTSFIDDIMMQTIYYTIQFNTGNLSKSGFTSSYYPMETHNKYIFNHLADTLNTLTNNKTFAYIHLFMPHSPMQYMPNFPIRTANNILNYKAYWDFTNHKLNTLLTELIRGNKYRIILTGDHGYRSEKRINPHYTFCAFYGFNLESIDKINSVQDLGSLINGGF